jgi:hypothetical protein
MSGPEPDMSEFLTPTARFPWGAIKGPPRLSSMVVHLFHCKLLLYEELSIPRPLPWRFEFSSMKILVPSGDLVLSFMVRSLPSSIQIPHGLPTGETKL